MPKAVCFIAQNWYGAESSEADYKNVRYQKKQCTFFYVRFCSKVFKFYCNFMYFLYPKKDDFLQAVFCTFCALFS